MLPVYQLFAVVYAERYTEHQPTRQPGLSFPREHVHTYIDGAPLIAAP